MEGDGGHAPKHPQQLFFDNVSPATRLLEKRRQMYEVQDALENQKARFAKEEEQFRKKEENLRMKDLTLQHQLFKFNKFLQDNEAKRRRAETRAAEEAAQIRQKEEEMRDLEQQLEESKQQCAELEDEVTKNMKYEEFLERVKDTCEEYSEIQDLVTRYDTLEIANKDLMKLQTESDNRMEELRNEFQNFRKEQEMEMLAFTNKTASLVQELEEVQKTRQQLTHQVDEATQEDSMHSLYFGRILMSVENLYLRCITKRKNIEHTKTHMEDETANKGRDGEQQEEDPDSFRVKKKVAIRNLKVILDYLKDFKDITETLKKERRSEATKNRQEASNEGVTMPAPTIKFEAVQASDGKDRGSTNSGSQGNTRELSKSMNQSGTAGNSSSSAQDAQVAA